MSAEVEFFVRFWGVRGSIPCPGAATSRYGGNTSCLEVRCGGRLLIFDAGTGLAELGKHVRGDGPLDAMQFLKFVREKAAALNITDDMLRRAVNVGYSGGEKKRNEVLQMAVLEPKLAILDETDSGLDIDALKLVAEGVNALRAPDRAMLIITHYQRLLDYIIPDFVHVLGDGQVVKSGDKSLALELEKKGYGWIGDTATAELAHS